AVDKLIAELIINNNQGDVEFPELQEEINRTIVRSWWEKILQWIRGVHKKANIDIFKEAANIITSGELNIDITQEGVFFQLSDEQKTIQDKFADTDKTIRKDESSETVDPLLMDTEEASSF